MAKKIDFQKLCYELYLAGIPNKGANSDGVIWDENHNDISQRADVLAIIEAHDADYVPEVVTVDERLEALETVLKLIHGGEVGTV